MNDRQALHTTAAARARALKARNGHLPPDGRPGDEILDSWARCIDAGLDSAAHATIGVVEAADLARRRERAAVTRRLAQAELETLAPQIAGSNFLLAFADREGVILDLYADNRFATSGADAGILPGSCWGEVLCGTNGLGTALATGRAVAVAGLEHYLLQLRDISCTAAPVRDAHGEIVGVLDASSYYESRQRHTMALVQMAATHIENGLLLHQMRQHLVLAVHPRSEFLGTLGAGLLAFDGEGRLSALNARGRQLLQGLNAVPGTHFHDLFGSSFEQLLAHIHHGGPLRLRDVLGSTLTAHCVSFVARPTPAPGAQAPTASAERTVPAHAPRGAAVAARAPASVDPDDPRVADAYARVAAAVRLQAPVLIQGETGTGKELLARHAHAASGRSGAFVAVNCAALPAELFEAEMFGYAGGAYTGAQRGGSAGLIASADRGTLLLDEVRELPLPIQAALLRFLDDHQVRPVGGTQTRHVDVQVLAASNVDLDAEAAAHRFRADLLYRLNTVRVDLPPLRLRRDFAAAVRSTLAALDRHGAITDAAIARLSTHTWPGNFRELRAVLTRALLTHAGGPLRPEDLAPHLPAARHAEASALRQGATELVRTEYERCGGSVSLTSRRLGISRTTVYRHLRRA